MQEKLVMQEIPAMTQDNLVVNLARMSTIHQRIKQLREQRQLSMEQLAELVGVSWQTVQQWENGKTAPKRARLEAVAKALMTTVEYLAMGASSEGRVDSSISDARAPWPFQSIPEDKVRALSPTQLSKLEGALALALGQMEIGLEVSRPSVSQAQKRGGLVNMDTAADEFSMRIPGLPPGPSQIKEPAPAYAAPRLSLEQAVAVNVAPGEHHAANDKFEKVPELADVRLAAGEGVENHTEEMTGFVQFRRSFLRSVGADGGRGRVVYAKGDSMEPIIRDGAALLVVPDLGLTLHDVAAGGIYAINYEGKMLVKTVAKDRLTGRWVARSLNSQYPDIPLEGNGLVRVLGRVVWAGAELDANEHGQWVRK
ncbi:repressor protein [Bordetella phage vB_BaM-IFTN3]|nr:repressor protein [Bordetella phage vB_BaM-IFTN1]UOK17179.1 repressor protein [Bordetella phage vB_BaM-IFTN3]